MLEDTNARNPIIDTSVDIVEAHYCSPLPLSSTSLIVFYACKMPSCTAAGGMPADEKKASQSIGVVCRVSSNLDDPVG
jgi:hypothetical protein